MTGIITIPFHIGDFLSGTLHMDAAETGAYLMLLLSHYQAGEKGLPDDDKKLARICRVTAKTWKNIRPVLEEKFELTDGFWRHSKVIDVLLKVSEKSSHQRAKVLKRHGAGHTAVIPESYQPKPKPKPIEKEVTNVTSKKSDETLFPDREQEPDDTGQAPKRQRGMRLDSFMAREHPESPESCPQEWGEAAVSKAYELRPNTTADFTTLVNWHFAAFYNFFTSSTKANAVKSDWRKAWMNWWMREFEKIAEKEKRDELYAQKRF